MSAATQREERFTKMSPELENFVKVMMSIIHRLDRLVTAKRISDAQAEEFTHECCEFLLSLTAKPAHGNTHISAAAPIFFGQIQAIKQLSTELGEFGTALPPQPLAPAFHFPGVSSLRQMDLENTDSEWETESMNFVTEQEEGKGENDYFGVRIPDNEEDLLETQSLYDLQQKQKQTKHRTFSLHEVGRYIRKRASAVRKSANRVLHGMRTPKSPKSTRSAALLRSSYRYTPANVSVNRTLTDFDNSL